MFPTLDGRAPEHAQQVPAAPANLPDMTTLRDRIAASGVNPDRAAELVHSGWYRVDGEVVTDLDTDTPTGSRVNVVPPTVTEHQL